MSSIHHRRLKLVQFALNAINFECQLRNWELDSGEQDGERFYTFCPDGEDEEETDPEPEVTLEFFADWRSAGISDFLWQNRGQVATMSIVHHPDVPAETVQFSGSVRLKAPPAGGEVRTTEVQEITLLVTNLQYARGA